MVFKYTKYPKAAKEFLRFMMEEEQYGPWMQAAIGYICQPLKAYESNPIWTSDPKNTPYRDCDEDHAARPAMPASWATRRRRPSPTSSSSTWWPRPPAAPRSPKEAAERAQKRAERYYKV